MSEQPNHCPACFKMDGYEHDRSCPRWRAGLVVGEHSPPAPPSYDELRTRLTAAEASLDALGAQVRDISEKNISAHGDGCRRAIELSDQQAYESAAYVRGAAEGRLFVAKSLAALLDPPSGVPQKNDDDQSRVGMTASSGPSPYRTDRMESQS